MFLLPPPPNKSPVFYLQIVISNHGSLIGLLESLLITAMFMAKHEAAILAKALTTLPITILNFLRFLLFLPTTKATENYQAAIP